MTLFQFARALERIHAALEAARAVLNRFTPGDIEAEYKVGTRPRHRGRPRRRRCSS